MARRDWITAQIAQRAAVTPAHAAIEIGPGSGVYLPLLAEALPRPALARWLEPRLLRGPGRGLLWTQYHTYRKPASPATPQAASPA